MRAGDDGNLYLWSRRGVLGVRHLESGRTFRIPLEIPHPPTWDMEDVLPGGQVLLRCLDEAWLLQPTRQGELERALENLRQAPAAEAPGLIIEEQEDHVVIGAVRLPVRRGAG